MKKREYEKVADIVNYAGGEIKGRTRLQKTAYLLSLAGLLDGFYFSYHLYGPYCEELADAAYTATAFKLLDESEEPTSWGGVYSIYKSRSPVPDGSVDSEEDCLRKALASKAANSGAIVLELAATAAYFAHKGYEHPWEETRERKPEKSAKGRLEEAQKLYGALRAITDKLPAITNDD